MGITNYFVNTIVTALKAPEWETLFQRFAHITHHVSSILIVRDGAESVSTPCFIS
jgi:hypothetical protein